MAHFLSIAVHSSIGMMRDGYRLIYKDTPLKYVPRHKHSESDCLIGEFQSGREMNANYQLLTEFLSAFAFANDAQIIPEPGMTSDVRIALKDYNSLYLARRRIPVDQRMDDFVYIPPVRTGEQSTLLRLFREARSASSAYFGFLFYWHCLVFPSTDDRTAVAYIDTTTNLPVMRGLISNRVESILQNPMFAPGRGRPPSLGAYLNEGIRNSVAHIIRTLPNTRNLDPDQFEELRHMNEVLMLLRDLARSRLENDYGLAEPHDLSMFRYADD